MKPEQQVQYRGRILVVDDEEPIGRLLQSWLMDEGYQARCALGFDEVCRSMAEEPFDLVTLDVMMPDVDGLQVLKWIKAHYPDTGVVMATALDDLDTVLEAMRAGASNYLVKPFKQSKVVQLMEELGF